MRRTRSLFPQKQARVRRGRGRLRLVHLSSLGGPHRHARIHDEALVSGVRRRRPLTWHLLL